MSNGVCGNCPHAELDHVAGQGCIVCKCPATFAQVEDEPAEPEAPAAEPEPNAEPSA